MSSVAENVTPRVVSVSKGQLEYQTSASSQWLPLQSYDNDREPPSTIHTIILREKSISFVQQTCGGAISCGVKLTPMQYGSRIKIGTIESGQSLPPDIIVELTREERCLTTCLRSASAGVKPTHALQQCPLARVCESFTVMRLYLPRDNFEPKLESSGGPNEFWFKIVNALRRDLKSAQQPILDTASPGERSIDLSSSRKSSPPHRPPSEPKVDITSGEERFNDLLSSQKKSTPPKKTSTPVQQVAIAPKKTSTPLQQVATYSEPLRAQTQKAPTHQSKAQTSSPAGNPVQKPPTTLQRTPVPPKPKQTSPLMQPVPPIPKQTSPFVQPVPPKSKQTSPFVQPVPPIPKQTSPFVQPVPPKPKQTSPFMQPVPPIPKQTSAFVQPTPPKSKQKSGFEQSQGFLTPKPVNQNPMAEPRPVNAQPRKIVDYKDLDSVVAVPSGSAELDYGDAATPSQKGSAKKPERPKWEASIIQLQKLEEVAELKDDKAMADKARKMIKIFEGDAANPGKETKAQVENFKRLWTLL